LSPALLAGLNVEKNTAEWLRPVGTTPCRGFIPVAVDRRVRCILLARKGRNEWGIHVVRAAFGLAVAMAATYVVMLSASIDN
jgi:hypothetical protein